MQAIFPGHDDSYTPSFLRQLHEDFNIPYSNTSNFSVCLVLAKEHSQILHWQIPKNKKFPTAPITDVEDSQKYFAPLNSNLDLF